MGRGGYAGEAFEQVRPGSVEELVGDAEDAAFTDCAEMVPVSLRYNFFERDAVSGSAPCEEENVGVGAGYGLWSGVGAGFAEVLATGDFDQIGDPRLGVDEGLAPFFAVDDGGLGSRERLPAGHLDGGFHASDEGFAFSICVNYGGNEADVLVDVVEVVRGQCEDGQAGFQDRGQRLHTIGDAGDNEVGFGSQDLVCICGPGVVKDLQVAGSERWLGFDAVFGAGAEVIKLAERSKGKRDGRLQ
jgi:hypothetical protein